MRKILLVVLFIIILVFPLAVSAQGLIPIESLQIELWPEYDRSEMLILYNIQLSEDTVLPVELTFRIPASAGEPNAVAIAVDNRWVNVDYTTEVQGDWTLVSFVSDSTYAHLEYYDPSLIKNGAIRNFEFTWLGDHPVDFLQFRVQEPINASEMVLSLDSTNAIPEEGINYYYSELNDLNLGESKSLTISYNKSSDALTFQAGSQPVDTNEESSSPFSLQFNPRVILGIVAVALIAYGIYNNFKPQRSNRRGSRRNKSRRTQPAKRKQENGNTFCHNCGSSRTKNDKFCRECGEKQRN